MRPGPRLGADAPVVVAVRVVDDLPDGPPGPGPLRSVASAGPRASGPVPMSACSAKYGASASSQASAVQPSAASRAPSSSYRCSAASETRRNMALRTSTRNARALAVTAGGASSATRAVSSASVGLRSFSHSSIRLESTCRTSSPSHSMIVDQFLGLGVLRNGLLERLVGVGEIAQHQPLGTGQPVEADVLDEGHRPLVHVPDDRLRGDLVVGDPRVPLPVHLVRRGQQLRQAVAARSPCRAVRGGSRTRCLRPSSRRPPRPWP